MHHLWGHPQALGVFGAVTAALLALLPAAAAAAPQRLDCSLSVIETKGGGQPDVAVETRPLVVVFDDEANALTVYQNGGMLALSNVTMTQGSINGYLPGLSLGIDASSWNVVLQTYKPDLMTAEFGACSLTAKPAP